MILSAQEFGQLMGEIAKCEWFREWLDNYVKEVVDAKLCEHVEDYVHKERELTVEEILAEKEPQPSKKIDVVAEMDKMERREEAKST